MVAVVYLSRTALPKGSVHRESYGGQSVLYANRFQVLVKNLYLIKMPGSPQFTRAVLSTFQRNNTAVDVWGLYMW